MAVRRSQFPPFPLVTGISVTHSDPSQERTSLFCTWEDFQGLCTRSRDLLLCRSLREGSSVGSTHFRLLDDANLGLFLCQGQDLLGCWVLDEGDMRSRGHRRESLL